MARAVISFLTVLAVAGGLALYLLREPPVPALRTGIILEAPAPVSAVDLINHRGEVFNRDSLTGYWTLVFPGFTHCPDICPTTLATLNQVQGLLGEAADRVQVVLLSVDPERDTPEALAAYVAYFNPAFTGVTGEAGQLDRLYRDLGVNYIRIPGAQGEYNVDHSAALLLIDPKGQLRGYFMPPIRAAGLAADLALLMGDE